MNIELKNVISVELGELLNNEKSDYCHRTIVIETDQGQIALKLYSKDANALKVAI